MAEAVTPATSRRHGVPSGRTERTERMVRTIYPDGTTVDSEPTPDRVGASLTWSGLANMFSRLNEPSGTKHIAFIRTVVIEASEWVEVPLEDSQHGAA